MANTKTTKARSTSSVQVKKETVKTVVKEAKAVSKEVKTEMKKARLDSARQDVKKLSKIIVGTVVSTKMKNTVVVSMTRKIPHKAYGKLIKVTKRIKADTNGIEVSLGDLVKIQQTKPMSKGKFFKVIKKEAQA